MTSRDMSKRIFDLALGLTGLAFALPVLALAALAIVMEDGPPVLFRQVRAGRFGRPFVLFKLRSMRCREERGVGLTVEGDRRVTRVGRFLRRYKVDELPQLWNVVAGQMSIVGPRPELPEFVSHYNGDERHVLDLMPGITDPASLAYFDEDRLLACADDVERTYVQQVLPEKVRMNLKYATRANTFTDLVVVCKTITALVAPSRWRSSSSDA